MQYDPKQLKASLEEATTTLPNLIHSRPMFGGFGVYADGIIFCTLSNVGIGLKLNKVDFDEVIELGGAPLVYEPGQPPSKTYALVPPEWHMDEAKLGEWAARAVRFVKGKSK